MARSNAERQRAYRARLGAAERGELQPCGTMAAYKRHKRAGETPCGACKDVYNAYHRDRYNARKKK